MTSRVGEPVTHELVEGEGAVRGTPLRAHHLPSEKSRTPSATYVELQATKGKY